MNAEATQVLEHQPTAITDLNTAVAEFDRVAAGIGALKQQFAGVVFDVTTTEGMKAACAARSAIRAPRYEIEKVRQAAKAPILALGRDLDARAKKITSELLAIEEPVDQQIKSEELRKEEERKARIEAERKRVAAIVSRIDEIKSIPASVANRSAAQIQEAIVNLVGLAIDSTFQEFATAAKEAREYMLTKLRQMHVDREAFEAEQERLRVEREYLAIQRAAQEEANRKERERIAAEAAEAKRLREQQEADSAAAIKAFEAAAAIDRKRKLDEELAKLRAQREEDQRAAKEQREAAAAERQRQQDELDRQRAEQEAAAKAERDRIEQQERELQAATEVRRKQLDAERADLQDQQSKFAAQREELEQAKVVKAQPLAVVESSEPERSPPSEPGTPAESWSPSALDITNLVAEHYRASFEQALVWCMNAFDEASNP